VLLLLLLLLLLLCWCEEAATVQRSARHEVKIAQHDEATRGSNLVPLLQSPVDDAGTEAVIAGMEVHSYNIKLLAAPVKWLLKWLLK